MVTAQTLYEQSLDILYKEQCTNRWADGEIDHEATKISAFAIAAFILEKLIEDNEDEIHKIQLEIERVKSSM